MKPLEAGDPLRLGPYRLIGVLGEGGMGKVYAGEDATGRAAAVKVLHPHLVHDGNLVQRFVREAQMARAVTGPGVARVLDARTEGGRPWIAAEFLTGPTLEDAVRAHGPLGADGVRALAAALAEALRDIHATGLVHRDLKPANVVITSAGPRVIDFGIARPEHGLTLTTTGQIPVTPGYGAPEQVLGQRVGPAADVFSLGALLVFAASGERAYEGTHIAAVQYEVVHGEPRMDRVPPELRPLIAPCLAKDPAQRPAPALIAQAFAPPRGADRVWREGPLAQDIKVREQRLYAMSTLSGSRPPASLPRRRLLTALAVGGAVTAVGGGAAGWWFWKRRDDPFAVPPAVRTPTARLLSARRGDYVLGETPDPIWSRPSVVGAKSPGVLPVRDVVICGNPQNGVTAYGVVDGKARWSAPEAVAERRYLSLSDRLIAAVDGHGTVRTFVASTGEPKWSAAADAGHLLAADAEAVYVVTRDGRLRSVSRSDAKVRWTAKVGVKLGGTGAARGLVSQGVLVVTVDGAVVGVDTGDGRTVWTLRDRQGLRPSVAVSGRSLLVSGSHLTARGIGRGEQLWQAPNLERRDGAAVSWGPPLAHGPYVYAAILDTPLRFDIADGKRSGWSYEFLFNCTPDTPMVIQGNGFWSLASNEKEGAVNVLNMLLDNAKVDPNSTEAQTSWSFRVIKSGESYWMTGDGNRVFLMHGDTLTALPVF
ncbi:protein kinase domain-containing protein [Streptomyces sp. NPDC004690]